MTLAGGGENWRAQVEVEGCVVAGNTDERHSAIAGLLTDAGQESWGGLQALKGPPTNTRWHPKGRGTAGPVRRPWPDLQICLLLQLGTAQSEIGSL